MPKRRDTPICCATPNGGRCRLSGRRQGEDGRWWCLNHWGMWIAQVGSKPLPPTCAFCTRFAGLEIQVDEERLPACARCFALAKQGVLL